MRNPPLACSKVPEGPALVGQIWFGQTMSRVWTVPEGVML
jgi:hypothetical protein